MDMTCLCHMLVFLVYVVNGFFKGCLESGSVNTMNPVCWFVSS